MKKTELEMEDDLRDEYDLKNLRVRRLGSERKSFGGSTVRLEPDVAEIFPNAESVNEALRFLIKVVQKNQLSAFTVEPSTALERTDDSP
ncbi:hypothetical protein Xen7305DRAFT_00042730 [Xenococcus sp. PCC 7305]|uniref:hypothetical protein n=1 Tax=Xenococcus sp. PCC 7305 TaxID=102125 RepID=UPI0002AC1D8F|nr:hypothetical protein [Xenococcus sp. PCC 7305]ELS04539.1 hypothetical protein Xen7305DRAFT_00042730 [Xenococcus sp. PCC 7305]